MKKMVYSIKIGYAYDPINHKGASYTFDGTHYMNHGEFMECVIKSVLGFAPVKDGSTPYDKDSDIPELSASVKSSRFTLTNMVLADTFEESIQTYFEKVHSTTWLYGIQIDSDIVIYQMDANEFKAFLREFASLNERKVIRAKADSAKLVRWLESRV